MKVLKEYFINKMVNITFEKSFASHSKAIYWDEYKNGEIKPQDVFKNSHKKYWFKCVICKHCFELSLGNLSSGGQWCPFCSHQKLCTEKCSYCFNNSFASSDKAIYWSGKNKVSPRSVFKSSNKKYWFKCGDCKHCFELCIASILAGRWCPFCSHQKLCTEKCTYCFNNSFASSDKAIYWSGKNKVSSRSVFKSTAKTYWFNCDQCTHPFEQQLDHIKRGHWCPNCVNKTETKLLNYLLHPFPKISSQFKQEWCKKTRYLPYDFCIPDLKLIIELDGAQHFRQVHNWDSYTKTRSNDIFKMKCALENGYSIIRLLQEDVWNNDELWLDTHLKPHLKLQDAFTAIYISTHDMYTDHIIDMENTCIIQFE